MSHREFPYIVTLNPVDPADDRERVLYHDTLLDAIKCARQESVSLHGYPIVEATVYWPDGEVVDPDDWQD